MTTVLDVLTSEDLNDFVDGRTDPEVSEAVLDLMSEDPEISLRIYDYRRQVLAMRCTFAVEEEDEAARRFAVLLREACAGAGGLQQVSGA